MAPSKDSPSERVLQDTQVEFEFVPAGDTQAPVEALAFTEYLTALVRALRLTADHLTNSKAHIHYDVVALNYNSPLNVIIEGRANGSGREIVLESNAFFASTIERLQAGELPASDMDLSLLRAYQRVGEASRRSRLVAAVRTTVARATVRPKLSERLDLVIEDDVEIEGTIEGFLQVLNVRGAPRIRLFPQVGPFVTGRLPRRLIPAAKAAVDEYVMVEGTLIYRPNEAHPRRIRVHDIHPIERVEVVPTFEDLWGAGADYRPEVSSLQLIEEMRSGWE